MSAGDEAKFKNYYIRVQGKIHGPFQYDQLMTLKHNGRFSRVHEVSIGNKRSWQPASSLTEFFPPVGGSPVHEQPQSPPTGSRKPEWYQLNSTGSEQQGPFTLAELRQRIRLGSLGPSDLVWKEGMADWILADSKEGPLSESFKPISLTDSPSPPTAPDRGTRASQRTSEAHPFDLLVTAMRQLLPLSRLQTTTDFFVRVAIYSLYAAIAAVGFYYIVQSIKTDSVNQAIFGVGLALCLSVLQYASCRIFAALDALIKSTPTRVTTTAFTDSLAVACIVAGVAVPTWLAMISIREQNVQALAAAALALGACEFVAAVALNPSFLNVTVNPTASTGEEAIGVLSFVMMMLVRVVPLLSGVGLMLGLVDLLWATAGLWIKNIDAFEQALKAEEARNATITLLVFAALPLAAYVSFLFYYLVLDVVRAVLLLPSKIETIGSQAKPNQPQP